MSDAIHEVIQSSILAGLRAIDRESGYSATPRDVLRFNRDPEESPRPPLIELQWNGLRKDLRGETSRSGYHVNFSGEINYYVARGAGEERVNLDRIIGLRADDVERALLEAVDWNDLGAGEIILDSIESTPFRELSDEEFYDGVTVEFVISYRVSADSARQLLEYGHKG